MNEPVTQGLMPLHYAVWQRYYEAAQLLLTRGGDVNAVDECGYSPLHLSAEHGFVLAKTEKCVYIVSKGPKLIHLNAKIQNPFQNIHLENRCFAFKVTRFSSYEIFIYRLE